MRILQSISMHKILRNIKKYVGIINNLKGNTHKGISLMKILNESYSMFTLKVNMEYL